MVRQIGIAIPSFNRVEMTIESFSDVYDDERINEIVIVDDASDIELYDRLKEICDCYQKVKLYRNIYNRDCYFNKLTALSFCSNPFNILLDSDNKIRTNYIDRVYDYEWDEQIIYTPDFAEPRFDFRKYSGLLISKENIAEFISDEMFQTMLNAANYFVNKNEYSKIWDGKVDPVTSDSIYFILKWLEAGNKIQVVSGMNYQHTIHEGSHYQNNIHRTPIGFHQSVVERLKNLA